MRLLQLVVCMLACVGGLAEVFSAISGIEAILQTEGVLMESLHSYLTTQEDRLQLLRKHYDIYKKEYAIAMEDVSSYLSNPLNLFKIIKRLNRDWVQTYKAMESHIPAKPMSELKESYLFPDEGDLRGSSEAIVRLQDLYRLDTADLAEGRILGKQASSPMTATDCFELGHQLASLEFFSNSSSWLSVALQKCETDGNEDMVGKKWVLEHMGYSSYMKGDIDMAVSALGQLLALEPAHPRALDNYHKYSELRNKSELAPCRDKPREPFFVKNFAELCRDELDLPDSIRKDLKCFYLTKTDPFLRLAPVKVEEHYLDPYIVEFYDVIYEEEINYIKEAAKSRLKRSYTTNFITKKTVIASQCISKHCGLNSWEHEVVRKINRRTRDLTGLVPESIEALQVANYGVGGHYEPHVDFYPLSDVEYGGRTVFPALGVGITPRKGSAVYWLNLHPSGEGNYGSLHGSCPVLHGTKWIANRWIRQSGQELRMPCNLEYQEEASDIDYPKPVFKPNHNKSSPKTE